MSIIQLIALIVLVGFVIFGMWLQFYIIRCHKSNAKEHAKEHAKRLREWIKRNPKRAKELGYTNMEKDDMPDDK
jgi:hypothetical protein